MDRITIAIPTYNRAVLLGQLLRSLQNYDLSGVQIVILNNASEDQTEQVASYYCSAFPDGKVRFITHSLNIGGDANFLRCFEHCQTEWLWILGDDDTPLHEAPQRILNEIDNNPDCDYINFRTDILDVRTHRNEHFKATGISEFIARMDCYSNILFISAGVYKASRFASTIEVGYRYIKAMSPQLAILISHLERSPSSSYCFSAEKIIGWQEPVQPHWHIDSLRRVCHLPLELLSNSEDRWLLLKKIDTVNELFSGSSLAVMAQSGKNSQSESIDIRRRYTEYNALTGRFDRALGILMLSDYLLRNQLLLTCLRSLKRLSKAYVPGLSWRISKLLDTNLAKPDLKDKNSVSRPRLPS